VPLPHAPATCKEPCERLCFPILEVLALKGASWLRSVAFLHAPELTRPSASAHQRAGGARGPAATKVLQGLAAAHGRSVKNKSLCWYANRRCVW